MHAACTKGEATWQQTHIKNERGNGCLRYFLCNEPYVEVCAAVLLLKLFFMLQSRRVNDCQKATNLYSLTTAVGR